MFMLGTGRCGSTIVFQVMAMHPDVGFISNLDDRLSILNSMGRANNAVYRRLPSVLQRRGGRWPGGAGKAGLSPSEGYRLFDRHVSPMLSTPNRDLTADDAYPWLVHRLRRFFETRAEAQGRPVFGHKLTGWPRAGLLHAAFPDARFIHVVRDGRAVASSLLQQPWWHGYRGPEGWTFGPLDDADAELWERSGRSFAVLAGLEWKRLMEAFEAARAELPASSWLELRYEEVTADPGPAFDRLLDHAGLRRTPEFDRAFASFAFTRSRAEAYRNDLAGRDIELLDEALGPQLAAYGYSTG